MSSTWLQQQEKSLGLLQRFQRIADFQLNQKADSAITIGYQPKTTNVINTNQTTLNQQSTQIALRPITPLEPKPFNPGSQIWIQNDGKAKEPLTTDVGSAVEDPYLDNLLQSALSADVQQRASFYDQIDLVFSNDPNAFQARENLLQGAFGQDQEQEVKPAKGYENDREAIRMADAANRLWQSLLKFNTPTYKIQVFREYLTYGNTYIRITWDNYGRILGLRALPVKTMKVNSDSNLSFYPGQPDCYIQYTRSDYSTPVGYWPQTGIIPIQNIQFQSDRYGMPFILPCLGYARGLIRGTTIIPDAREAGQPIVHENHQDAMGNKVYKAEINEARWFSLEERKNRNEPINAYRHNITNGSVKLEMLSADGAFWNDLSDFNWFARGITSIFNRTFAKQVGAEVINRATLDRITENDYEGEYRLGLLFASLHDGELLNQAIEITNFAIAQLDQGYGLQPGNLYIDKDKVKLVTKIKGRLLPERLVTNCKLRLVAASNGFYPAKQTIMGIAETVGDDPDEAYKQWLVEREQGIIVRGKPLSPSMSLSGKSEESYDENDNPIM